MCKKVTCSGKKALCFPENSLFLTLLECFVSGKTAKMMVKLLIYDSCMIVKKETVMPICYDVQVIYKKHDSMIVVF